MNLRDLQYLAAVADHLHFGKAAEACNVSQPTLSMQLKKLEETLGVQLFERTNKSVMLTAIGSDITARAKRILEESQQLREAAKAAVNPLSGDLRLGIFPTLAPYLLPTLMPKLKKQFPLLNLLLVEEKTANLVTQLEEGKIDCAMLAMPVDNPAIDSKKLFDEAFVLAVPANHRLAKRASVSQSDIRHETMLLLEEGHCLREQALEVCSAIGIGESNSFRATSLETLRYMVAAGNAVTLMPKLSVRNEDALVRYIPFKKPAPMRSIGLYWRKTSPRTLLFSQITQMIASAYKQ
jgi:LysR family hydrogen peroxide-inducible transcriptional activator